MEKKGTMSLWNAIFWEKKSLWHNVKRTAGYSYLECHSVVYSNVNKMV